MKFSIVAALVFSPIFSPILPTEWQVFKQLDGNFSILSPGKLEEKIDQFSTKIGPIEGHTHFFYDKNEAADNTFYLVKWWDFPVNSMHSDSTELLADFWKTTLEGEAENLGGKLAWQNDAPGFDGKWPGQIARIDYRKGRATAKIRWLLVKNRLFTLQTLCPANHALNASTDRFFDSFRLLADPRP